MQTHYHRDVMKAATPAAGLECGCV